MSLRADLEDAIARGKADRAEEILAALEAQEPQEPRWPHRRGDFLRDLGRTDEAVEAFARAVDRYAARGFLARAIAMAKTVLAVDPSRTDVLAKVDPDAARALKRPSMRTSTPRMPAVPPPPAPIPEAAPIGVTAERIAVVPTLSRAPDAEPDEVRFDPDPSIELDLSDTEVLSASEPGFETSAERLALLPLFPLFANVELAALHEIAVGSELVVREAGGDPLVRAGEPADALWGIVEGAVRIEVPGRTGEPIRLGEGELFGEASLLDGEKRRADVRPDGPVTALRIPRDLLKRLVDRHPSVGEVLFEILVRRLVANLVATSPIFGAFDDVTRRAVAKLFEVRRASDGTALVEVGKRSDGLYVVLAGKILVGSDEAGCGTVFGQRAILTRGVADRSIRAKGEVVLLRLPASRFQELVTGYPPVLAHLADLGEQADASVGIETFF